MSATITLKVTAYYYPSFQDLDEILDGKATPFFTAIDGIPKDGVAIGDADVVVTIRSQKEILRGQLDSLNEALNRERAESQQRQNAILDQISKLQALEWEGVQA